MNDTAPGPGQYKMPKAPLKIVTHFLGAVIVAVAGFAVTPAGVALIKQYPQFAMIATGIGALAALYHSPRES
jgi:hypothetical protein